MRQAVGFGLLALPIVLIMGESQAWRFWQSAGGWDRLTLAGSRRESADGPQYDG